VIPARWWPTSPEAVAGTMSLDEIINAWRFHSANVSEEGTLEAPELPANPLGSAVAALVLGTVIGARALAPRWEHARLAMLSGGTVAEVSQALGLDDDETVAGLRSWADQALDWPDYDALLQAIERQP
jgi:hypothetical protein